MRFAIQPTPQHRSWQNLLEFFVAADEIPVFEAAYLADHFYPTAYDADGQAINGSGIQHEGWIATAAVAQATSRLRVGPMVTCIAYRNIGLLAKMAASVDVLSHGRLELGLGAGWNEVEGATYGIDLGNTKTRIDRFEESLDALRRLFVDDEVNFEGAFVTLHGARIDPKSVQRPHPPFLIGGHGRRRILPLVARYAQHWNLSGQNPDGVARRRSLLHEQCAAIGRDPAEIMISSCVRLRPGDDYGEVAVAAKALGAAGADMVIIVITDPAADASVLQPLADALSSIQ